MKHAPITARRIDAAPYGLTAAQRALLTAWRTQLDEAITAGAFNAPRCRKLVGEIAFTLRMDSEIDAAIFMGAWRLVIEAEIASVARFAEMHRQSTYAERVSPAVFGGMGA